MSKFKKKFGRRILAYLLSGAMIMSNLTAFASETSGDSGGKYSYEETSEVDDTNADNAEENAEADEVLRNEESTSEEKEDVKESSDEAIEETKEKNSEKASEVKSLGEEQASETEFSLGAEKETEDSSEYVDEEEMSEARNFGTEDAEEKSTDEDVKAYDANIKTDVWDFGGATVENTNNMITSTDISNLSTAGEHTYGDLKIYSSSHIEKDIAIGDSKGIRFYGINNGRKQTYYSWAELTATAGDVITVEASATSGDIIFAQRTNSGFSQFDESGGTFKIDLDALSKENTQLLTTDTSKTADTLTFYAPADGNYLIISGNITAKSLVLGRITREHVDEVTVSGSVTASSGADLSNATLTFTDDATNETKDVAVSSNPYSVNLYNKHSYTISASEGFEVADDCKTLDLSNNSSTSKTLDITLNAAAATAELSGSITVPETLLESLKITFIEADDTNKSVEAVIDKTTKTYTAELKTNVAYTIKTEADYINDYELATAKLGDIYADGKITITGAVSKEIEYTALPVQNVSLTVSGKNIDGSNITEAVLKSAGARLVFTRNDTDAYTYTFKVGEQIQLREGTYSVKTENSANITDKNNTIDKLDADADKSAYIATSPIGNLTVGTSNNNLAIEYQYATEWDFTSSEFKNTKLSDQSILYNGLFIKYAKAQNNICYVYSYPKYSTIRIPVKGACRVTLEIDSLAETKALKEVSGGTGNEKEIAVTNGKYVYDYTGTDEGAVIVGITNSATSGDHDGGNISKITVTYAKQIEIASNITNGSVSVAANGKTSAIPGDTVKLSDVATAEPGEGYAFSSWKVTDADGTDVLVTGSSTDDYSFVMPEKDVTISAEFIALGSEHNINIAEASSVQNGTVTAATGDNSITTAAANASVDLDLVATVEPAANYVLSVWEITYQDADGEQKITVSKNAEGKYIFTMPDSDITVKPIFVRQYKINIAAAASIENGTVTAKSQEQYAVQGDKVLLKNIAEATPNTGYIFKEWKVTYQDQNGIEATASVSQNDDGDDIFTMPDSDVTISAVFEIKPVKYVAEGTHSFDSNGNATLVMDGFEFTKFTDEGNSHGVSFTNEATMTLNLKEKANITVVSCCYVNNTTVAMTASSGEVSETIEKEEGKDRKKFTVLGATGELVLTFGGSSWIHSVTVEYPGEVAAGSRNIDVWDFGGLAEEDKEPFVYNNNITADGLKSIIGDTKGLFVAGPKEFGDLTMYQEAKDRLYTKVPELSASSYGTGYEYEYSDYKSAGAWYCNGTGGSSRRYVTVKMQAGDKLIAYMGSSQSGDIKFAYEGQGGAQGQTDYITVGVGKYERCEFVAKKTGTYKVYASDAVGKPVYHRFVRVPGIEVSGTINYGEFKDAVANASVKFKNLTTKAETVAEVDTNGNFSAILAPGYEYKAILSGAIGYTFAAESKNFTTQDEEYKTGKNDVRLTVVTQEVYAYSGEIIGFAEEYDISKLAITMIADKEAEAEDVDLEITQGDKITFTAALLPEVKYTFEMEGVDDYEVKEPLEVNNTDGSDYTNKVITVGLKQVYPVTGAFMGLDDSAQVSALTFTNAEDGYIYEAAINEDGKGYSIELRDGSYLASATVTNFKTQTHVVVNGSAVNKNLMFVSTVAKDKIAYAADIYVGYQDNANNYETVSKAVEAAALMNRTADQRVTVHIAPGVYREQIVVNTPNVTFINDTDKEVLLTWYYGIGYKYYSADSKGFYNPENAYDRYEKNIASKWGTSVHVTGDAKAFRAQGITFENSFNRYITDEELEDGVEVSGTESITFVRKPGVDVTSKTATERATVIVIEGSEAEFKDCRFYSSQDTIYTGKINAYFKNCVIEGQTDYIFGEGSNVVFDACELSWKGYSTGSQGGYITAHRQASDNSDLGYLFRSCTVTGNHYNKLEVKAGSFGRPWGEKSKVVFMNTKLQNADLINAKGWTDWNTPAKDANYYEYNTVTIDGTVVDTSQREGHVMTGAEAAEVRAENYFGGWMPTYYQAEAAEVVFATVPFITSNGDLNTPYPGNTLTVGYSIGENDVHDVSVIQWYRVKDEERTLLKTSNATAGKTYKIDTADIGSYIEVVVTPTTVSGNTGEPASFKMTELVRDGYEDPDNPGVDPSLGEGVNIFLVGDSTVKDYSAGGINSSGKARDEGAWGEFLQSFFNSDKVTVVNYANGGRSSRNFINEGSLDKVVEKIGEGDYMFIQFGHNDCSDGAEYLADRYVPLGKPNADGIYPTTAGVKVETPPELADKKYGNECYTYNCGGTFKWYLLQYVNAAKEKGAIPVLVTPVSRMYYNSDGTIKPHHDSSETSNNAYVTAVKQLADEQNVLLIDGFELTKTLFEDAYKVAGNDSYGQQIMHTGDKTHNNKLGGMIEAAAIAAAIQNMNLNISTVVKAPENVLGETTKGETVFSVDNQGKFTAYDILTNYAEKASYWTEIGQKMFDAIKEKQGSVGDKDTVGTITASPDPKDPVGFNTMISLTCATEGVSIYYTIDGSNPTAETGTPYTEAFSVGETAGTVTIKAIAVKEGMKNSEVYTFIYTVSADAPGQVAAPEADPKPGTVAEGTTVKLTCATEGALIYYTIGGADPTAAEENLYKAPISLGETEGIVIIKAIAVKEGWTNSIVSTFEYTVSGSTENPDEEIGDTEESKITVDNPDTPDGKISVRNASKIKVEAANLVETHKVQYAVIVTYTYKDKDGKTYQQQLTEGLHYDVAPVKGFDAATPGTQKVNIIGTDKETDLGTFTDTKTISYEIKAKAAAGKDKAHDIARKKFILNKDDVRNAIYTGTYITPAVVDNDSVGEENYSVVYRNNVNVGKASVTITGKGEYYGSKTLTFSIRKADISKQTVAIEASNATFGDPVVSKTRTAQEIAKGDLDYKGEAVTFKNLTVKLGDVKLNPRADYTVTYKKNAQAGTATAAIKGMNNLSGAINISYEIRLVDITSALAACNTDEKALSAEYSSKGARLAEITLNGVTLREGKDYKVNYKGCKKAAEITELPAYETVKVTGAGSYKNQFKDIEVRIKAEQGSYHVKDGAVVDKAKLKGDTARDNKTIISAAKITDAAGVRIKPETVEKIEYTNNTVKVTPADASKYQETTLNVHVAKKLGSVKPTDKKAKIADRKFDGVNLVTLTETEIIKSGVLSGVEAKDIRIVSYKNNNKVGSATVTIEGRSTSEFYGTKSLKFKIVSEKAQLKDASGEEVPDTGDSTGTEPGTEEPGTEPSTEEPSTEPSTEPEKPTEAQEHTLWLVGDSTVCSFTDSYYYPRYGYGTQIENYETGYYKVENLALSGRSSKSFLSEANYATLTSGIKEGDVLIIGFGHNDEKAETDRYTNPNGDYQTEGSFAKSLYDNYVKIALGAKATPILCTPIVRRNPSGTLSDADCHITTGTTDYPGGDYAKAIRDLGTAVSVEVVDLTAYTKELYTELGADGTLKLHAWLSNKEGSVDNTHLNIYGAKKIAYKIAKDIQTKNIEGVSSHFWTGAEPTEADLVSNPAYKEPEYTAPADDALSALCESYMIGDVAFKGTAFGDLGGAPSKGNHILETDADGNMHIQVKNNAGKIATTTDGIVMYYYKVPAGSRIELSAKATIKGLDTTNNQAAFGLMARDDMWIDVNSTDIKSDYVVAGSLGKGCNCFFRKDGGLGGRAKLTNPLEIGKTYDLKIESSGDGYACTFGTETTQTGGYDFQLLSVDSEYFYVGMFAARNADVTFSNIKLVIDGVTIADNTTADTPGGDDPVEDEPIENITVEYNHDDLAAYNMEGFAASAGVTGGGTELKEGDEGYYIARNEQEFLEALKKARVRSSLVTPDGPNGPSVIEITAAELKLGNKENPDLGIISAGSGTYSGVIRAYDESTKYYPLIHPTLLKTGVSWIKLNSFENMTIFSSNANGTTIKHAGIVFEEKCKNIIFRNLTFDELWEWDDIENDKHEYGSYDRNDWDYISIDKESEGIWIDHCTFYKSYDGIIDIKRGKDNQRVTVSWCQFLPASKNETFFNEQMTWLENNKDSTIYYKKLRDEENMSPEEVKMYAYGQKKTHLFGYDDDDTTAEVIKVTLANNYYKDSMDRLPRLRRGTVHEYNCVLDSSKLYKYDPKGSKKITSNGALSTCNGEMLLENCYIDGIRRPLMSGNGSSPRGYIKAVNSVWYLGDEDKTKELNPTNHADGQTIPLVTNATKFKRDLPYTDYRRYRAEELKNILAGETGGAGAGSITMTAQQWMQTQYTSTSTQN